MRSSRHAVDRPGTTRRTFLSASLAVPWAAASRPTVLPAGGLFAAGGDSLRVGLIGCGGRGTGAALQAAAADPGVRIVAMADLFADQIASSGRVLSAAIAPQFDCPAERRFVSADAHLRLLGCGVDIVLLTAPPHVRPLHVEAAVAAGKHLFCEKPVAIDVAGVQRVAEAFRRARSARLSVVSGLCFRRDAGVVEAMARVHDGAIGRPLAVRTHAECGLPWRRPVEAGRRGDEPQLRNWISFRRFSGGPLVEHHVHAIDRALWALGDEAPVAAVGRLLPGRRDRWSIGDCLDGVAVRYTFADGRSIEASCRRLERLATADLADETVVGSRGEIALLRAAERPGHAGRPDRWQAGMDALLRGVRSGAAVDDGPIACRSTLVAIMGREAAESGRPVTWEECAGPGPGLV